MDVLNQALEDMKSDLDNNDKEVENKEVDIEAALDNDV